LRRKAEVAAILVAAGVGRRMASGTRGGAHKTNGKGAARGAGRGANGQGEKVFRILCGKPLLFHSLKTLESSPEIDRIVIVVRKPALKKCVALVKRFGFKKVHAIVAGGKKRQDSVQNGLSLVGNAAFVLIHDGARPFLNERLISTTLAACKKTGAAVAALPMTDTVTRVRGSWVEKTVSRRDLWSAQTPQVFRRAIIERAFRLWPRGLTATDDASMVRQSGRRVAVVKGDLLNIKITFASDLETAESLLQATKKSRE